MPNPFFERLANGLALTVIEVPGRHQVLVSLLVRVGSRFEKAANNGASHFLEHMLFRGNAVQGNSLEIFRLFEGVGGVPNAVTEVEFTEFYFVAHPGRVAAGLEGLAHLVREPVFPAIEKERRVVADEILYDYDDRGQLIHPGALAAKLLWGRHPLALSVSGTPTSLQRLDEGVLRAHHRTHYTPDNMVLGLAGNISPADALDLAGRFFGDWPSGGGALRPVPAPETAGGDEPRIRLVPHADNQFQVQLSFPAPGYNAPEEIALLLMGRLLDDGPASRLQHRIREERGLVYHIGAGYSGFQDAGQLDISTSVQVERLGEVVEGIVSCLAELRDEGPSEEEMVRARQRHRFDVEFERDSLAAALGRYAWPHLYTSPRSEQEELRLVEETSAENIRSLAGRIFRPGRAHLVVVGPVGRRAERAVRQALKGL